MQSKFCITSNNNRFISIQDCPPFCMYSCRSISPRENSGCNAIDMSTRLNFLVELQIIS